MAWSKEDRAAYRAWIAAWLKEHEHELNAMRTKKVSAAAKRAAWRNFETVLKGLPAQPAPVPPFVLVPLTKKQRWRLANEAWREMRRKKRRALKTRPQITVAGVAGKDLSGNST
jgi:hypothetical protein